MLLSQMPCSFPLFLLCNRCIDHVDSKLSLHMPCSSFVSSTHSLHAIVAYVLFNPLVPSMHSLHRLHVDSILSLDTPYSMLSLRMPCSHLFVSSLHSLRMPCSY